MEATQIDRNRKLFYYGANYEIRHNDMNIGKINLRKEIPPMISLYLASRSSSQKTLKERAVYIAEFEISEQYKFNGLGTQVLRSVEALAALNDLVRVRICENTVNAVATTFLHKNGYVEIEKLDIPIGVILFEKRVVALEETPNTTTIELCIMEEQKKKGLTLVYPPPF